MVDFWRIQVTSFGQPGRTDRHPEDAGSLLVVASCPDEGVGRSASMSGSYCDTAFSLNASSPSLYDERLTRSFRKCPSVPLSTYNPTLP
jgi:hypothetical protein